MRHFFACILYIALSMAVIAQAPLLHCGADSMQHLLIQQHPEILSNWTARKYQSDIHTHTFGSQTNQPEQNPIYTLPVVVHVIHNEGIENISDAQILNGIEILNRNFQKLNPDTTDIIPAFKPIAANMQLEFKLAKKDPQGNCTNGINRIRSFFSTTGGHEVKSLIHWPRNQYINIYVVRNAAGLAGHALMPFQADTIPGWDGIVISGDYFGAIGTSNPVASVVLSHELGHFLNLYHIWGGNNVPGFYYLPVGDANNCNTDDEVDDTPNTIGWSTCNLNASSCGNPVDNVQNFMDYAYCARMFTEGQKVRVHAALNSTIAERNALWQPSNLVATGVNDSAVFCKVDFGFSRNVVCVGDPVQFFDQTQGSVSLRIWDFGDGVIDTVANPVHSYSQPGLYTVSLAAGDGNQSMMEQKTSVILVQANTSFALPIIEGFETNSLFDTKLEQTASNGGAYFGIQNLAASQGDKSLRLLQQPAQIGQTYSLILPRVQAQGVQGLHVSFKYAFAQRDSSNADFMVIKTSTNCGLSWTIRRTIRPDELPTHPIVPLADFIPGANDWRTVLITNIPNSNFVNGVQVKIEFIGGGGNALYIDEINLYNSAFVSVEESVNTTYQLFPNPGTTHFQLQANAPIAYLSMFDLQGRRVLHVAEINQTAYSQPVSNLTPGIYLVEFVVHGKIYREKWIRTP